MAKGILRPKIDEVLCCGCSLCVVNCPFGCLKISRPLKHGDVNTFAELTLPKKCTGCKLCRKACPVDAITMEEE